MNITYNQMFEAARAGYPVRVMVNGEYYDIKTDANKKDGDKNDYKNICRFSEGFDRTI